MAMNKNEIAKASARILLDTKSVLVNAREPFTYTSGKTGPVYVDIRRMISFPKERTQLMDFAAQMLKPIKADYIAGGETAGIPFAAFIAERLNAPMLYIRKKPKGHGRMAQIEGFLDGEGKHILLVEDLMNRGTSQNVFIDAIRAAGAAVHHSFVLFSYDIYPETQQDMADMGITVHALTNWRAVVECAREGGDFDTPTLASLEKFLRNPDGWTPDSIVQSGT